MCFRANIFRVSTKRVRLRNVEKTEWSLVAQTFIPSGTFLGFYTGVFDTNERESLYSVKINSMFIYPFENESAITQDERLRHPFANINEPDVNTHANCCMMIQDFDVSEVEHGDEDPRVRFYRGLACFTCKDIYENEELTWHYGKSYEANRALQGYQAGWPCEKLLQKLIFIPSNSSGVLKYMSEVPLHCVFPIYGTHKSERFMIKKRKRMKTSDDDSDTSSSGSGHIPKYVAPTERREERLARRNTRLTGV